MGYSALALYALIGVAQSEEHASLERFIRIAKESVRAEVLHAPMPAIDGSTLPKGVFVTIERNGKILGCRGDLRPQTRSLEEEVAQAARSAAQHDPRYRPLTPKDLDSFLVTVTVVEGLDPVSGVDGLAPAEGLVLESGDAKGVVLPWEGKDPRTRLKWAYKKAGVPEGTPVRLYILHGERERG